jgi:hypothetical protein
MDIDGDNLLLGKLYLTVKVMHKRKVFDEIGNFIVNINLFDERLFLQQDKSRLPKSKPVSSTLLRRWQKYRFDYFIANANNN